MKHYIYKLIGSDPAPAGGDIKSWLYYYKWGREELVSLPLREPNHIQGVQTGDGIFILLDGLIIGYAILEDVQEGYVTGVVGSVQELLVHGNKILEFKKGHRLRLKGDWKNPEVPSEIACRWLRRPYRSAKFKPAG